MRDDGAVELLIARNPDPDSRLPYLLRLPLREPVVLRTSDTWPRTKALYCHPVPATDWPDQPEIVERVPVRSCARRGLAIDLVLDRARENRSQIVYTTVRGRDAVFWQSPRTRKQARPQVALPTARAAGIRQLEIVIDSRERYAYRFGTQQVTTTVRALRTRRTRSADRSRPRLGPWARCRRPGSRAARPEGLAGLAGHPSTREQGIRPMTRSDTAGLDDVGLARRCADLAGTALLRERRSPGPDLGDRGDALAHRVIVDTLRDGRPADAILSEEAADDSARLAAPRVWIVDPLDGTREYVVAGRPDWAVHVALWERGRLTAGAVAVPAIGVTYATDAPPAPPPRHDRLRITLSGSRPPAFATPLAEQLGAELVPLGSVGFKVAAVLRGAADAYVHSGGLHEWDTAAPVAVAQAAGLHATRLDGTELSFNAVDLWGSDLLVCRPELAVDLMARIAAVRAETD